MSEKENIKWDMPPVETVNEKELAYDTILYGNQRHENSIIDYVTKDLADKGVLATTVFSLFMDKNYISPYTGKKTYMNVEESYICSGVYDKNYLDNIYEVTEKKIEMEKNGTTWLDTIFIYNVINETKDRKIRSEAINYFNKEGLSQFFQNALVEKFGGVCAEDLLRSSILTDAIYSEDIKDKNANRKMLIDILGMKVVKHDQTINLRKRGGGEIIEDIASTTGGGFLRKTPLEIEGK